MQVALQELRNGNRICLLKKVLYGLRQAGRVWYRRLYRELRDIVASPTTGELCVYTKMKDNQLVVIVYVDDILTISQDESMIKSFEDELRKRFEIKDVGEPK